MSCARCEAEDDSLKVSLTTTVHEGLCATCHPRWVRHAQMTKTDRNPRGAAVVRAFRRWCAAGKEAV